MKKLAYFAGAFLRARSAPGPTALALMVVVAFCVGGTLPAWADSAAAATAHADTVAFPLRAWLSALLNGAASFAIAAIGFAVHRFGGPALSVFVTDKMISDAVNYAIGAVEGATPTEVDVRVANSVAALAAKWVVANEPMLAEKLGDALGPMILAKMTSVGIVSKGAVVAPIVQAAGA